METVNSLAFIQNLNWTEVVVILIVFILLFGAKKLPELARDRCHLLHDKLPMPLPCCPRTEARFCEAEGGAVAKVSQVAHDVEDELVG